MDVLRLQGLLLRPPGTPALLTPYLFSSHPLGADEPRPEPLDPVEEKAAGEKAVQRLGTFLLAFYGEARRLMDEKDARGGLVDLLPPGTGGTDEGFAELLLPHAEALHPFPERRIFFLRDGHCFKGKGCQEGQQYDSEGIDLILDQMDPISLEHLPRLVDLVHAEDDDRLLADPVDCGIEIVDVDLRLGEGFQDCVHSAGMERHLGGENRGNLIIEIETLQDGRRPLRVVDDHPDHAAFRGAGGEQGLRRDVFLVEDVRQPGKGSRDVAQQDGDLLDCHFDRLLQ